MTTERAFLWLLPVLIAVCVILQLYYKRVVFGRWRKMQKSQNEGRFWLFIVAECVVVVVLVGQAISGAPF